MPIDTKKTFIPLSIAVLVVSDTRDIQSDRSGKFLSEAIVKDGHNLAAMDIVTDDKNLIVSKLQHWIKDSSVDIIISTGGTGLTARDVTPEALEDVASKHIPGFGELFRYLSFAKIGTSTIQSRALAVLADTTYIFALPGSTGACRDAWNGILSSQLDSRYQPCNFIELIPRLSSS
jgi:molybdenum cofactor biosynthesis protein B